MNKIDTRRRSERRGKELVSFQAHLKRLQNVRPAIDTSEPKKHPLSNKKERMKRREYSLIEQNNRILLDRLAKIVQTKTIDNEISASTQKHHELKQRLGLLKKRDQMQKITDDNQRLLKRIQETPSAYNHLQWEEDARRLEAFKRTMSLFPEFYDKNEKQRAGTAGSRSPGSPSSLMREFKRLGLGSHGSPGSGGGQGGSGGFGPRFAEDQLKEFRTSFPKI